MDHSVKNSQIPLSGNIEFKTFDMDGDGNFSFVANEEGIVKLKSEFLIEAEEFLLLRKGEDIGGELIALFIEVVSSARESIEFVFETEFAKIVKKYFDFLWEAAEAYALYRTMRETIIEAIESYASKEKRQVSSKKLNRLNILCFPDEENEKARLHYERLGYQVRHYRSADEKGLHRFYVNEKRWCFFLRSGEQFKGVVGTDQPTILKLVEQFDLEWKDAREPRRKWWQFWLYKPKISSS